MARWVKVCSLAGAPEPGTVMEADAAGKTICLANLNGAFSALDNMCPHRGGPLGQGWIEGESVVCPWHSWTFNLENGEAETPVNAKAKVLPLRVEDGEVLVEVEREEPS